MILSGCPLTPGSDVVRMLDMALFSSSRYRKEKPTNLETIVSSISPPLLDPPVPTIISGLYGCTEVRNIFHYRIEDSTGQGMQLGPTNRRCCHGNLHDFSPLTLEDIKASTTASRGKWMNLSEVIKSLFIIKFICWLHEYKLICYTCMWMHKDSFPEKPLVGAPYRLRTAMNIRFCSLWTHCWEQS